MQNVYLVEGARTPQGRYGGVLASLRPDDPAATVVTESVYRAGKTFAPQSLGVIWQLKLDENIVNTDGGVIALGHPLSCSRARILLTLLGRMERGNHSRGLATLCVGVGQGVSLLGEAP